MSENKWKSQFPTAQGLQNACFVQRPKRTPNNIHFRVIFKQRKAANPHTGKAETRDFPDKWVKQLISQAATAQKALVLTDLQHCSKNKHWH